MKQRLLFDEVREQLEHKNALVITGMRQVGKTTLMRALFDEVESKYKLWFDFDNPLDQKLFENEEYKNIYEELKKQAKVTNDKERLLVCIDEIQNFPEITKVIKYLIDHYKVKFIVTGSSAFYLKNLFPESLSGRKFLYRLNPLYFGEVLYFKGLISREDARSKKITNVIKEKHTVYNFKKREIEYKEYLEFGGFPEVVLTDDKKTKKMILNNIFASFFEKDIRLLSDFNDIREIRDLILLLVPRVGSMIDVSKLASELQASRPRVYSYLEFLQGTFFLTSLAKFSKSVDRSVAGGRKMYFADNGILNMVGKVNEAQLLENAVVNQMQQYGELSFYNKKNISEIDVVVDKEFGFEIKTTGTSNNERQLKKHAKLIGLKKSFIVSKNFREDVKDIIYPQFL